MKNTILFSIVFSATLILTGCQYAKKAVGAINQVNVFTVEDDIRLGKQVKEEILGNPSKFPVLPEAKNRELYRYIRGLRDIILRTGTVKYKDKFAWEIKIIKDDKVLNAFATPGGYIFVYTGLMKFLDSEDELLGVLGHEMAHADRRHSTRQLTKNVGVSMLLDAALGKKSSIQTIVSSLLSIQFTRSDEAEADDYSVRYLCPTAYNAAGSAGFFKKMLNQPSPPEFLSTHPSPKNRVKDIEAKKAKLNCSGTRTNVSKYNSIKKLL